ncbi:hypothetical protein D3C73_1063350 [compost metagenome]
MISNPWLELDGYFKLELPGEFEAGNSIVCNGTTVKVYNSKGGFKKEITLKQPVPALKTGKHTIKFDCGFTEESEIINRFIIKTISSPEVIAAK